ncbi:hypothetical protein PDJAM_G00236720, partial [Pangasius djambal]|nr:hypothetical protein [Pangasius djambal]
VVEIALKVSPVLASHVFQALLPAVFRGVIEGERYPVVMSTYLGIIGRLLLQNSSFFSSLLTQMAMEFNQEQMERRHFIIAITPLTLSAN